VDAFVIEGGRGLSGTLRVNGSKNASLPLLACALLTDEPVTLRGVPRLADISNMLRLLEELGCGVRDVGTGEGRELHQHVSDSSASTARYDIVRTMRASICVLGPMLAKRGEVRVALPGGCAIGHRPVDLHLRGLEALGATITFDAGYITAKAPAGGRLRGASIFMGGNAGPTVLGTANIMSAACLADGRTVIESAACEPEIVDVARLLNAMGAKISGAGTPRITVDGIEQLGGADHEVMSDRIEAGTYIMACAAAGGEIVLQNCPLDSLMAACDHLKRVGVHVQPVTAMNERGACDVRVTSERELKPIEVTTHPHPGFPTDLQAQMMALLCLANGISVVTERIYTERFLHVAELARMGAHIIRQGPTAVVSGAGRGGLIGAPVMASDLRASACLIIAGLSARGTTTVRRVYHLDRGYEKMEQSLAALGASIKRVDVKDLEPDEG